MYITAVLGWGSSLSASSHLAALHACHSMNVTVALSVARVWF